MDRPGLKSRPISEAKSRSYFVEWCSACLRASVEKQIPSLRCGMTARKTKATTDLLRVESTASRTRGLSIALGRTCLLRGRGRPGLDRVRVWSRRALILRGDSGGLWGLRLDF